MIVGTCELRISLAGARSLKDKRRVISSLKSRIRNKFNVSVAEIDAHNFIQSATLGVAQVANDTRYLDSSLAKLVDMVRTFPAARLVDYSIEIH